MYQSLFMRLLAMLMLFSQTGIYGQDITQTIRGSVIDLNMKKKHLQELFLALRMLCPAK